MKWNGMTWNLGRMEWIEMNEIEWKQMSEWMKWNWWMNEWLDEGRNVYELIKDKELN